MDARWLARRLGQILVVLVGISFITFTLVWLAPGDPARAMYTSQGITPTPEMVEQMRARLGLDEPFPVQYATWLGNCLHGNFGTSYSLNKPVTDLMLARLWPTVELSLAALLLMLVIAIPLGMLAAVHQGGVIDHLARGLSFLGVSMPNFWFGLLLIWVVALKLGWLPVVSTGPGPDRLVMPAVTLAFAMIGKYTRQVRTAVLEELGQDYVTGARARGLSRRTILWRHVLPNARLPLLTLLGLSLGSLLGGTAVVEVVFSYPGLGNMAVSAVTSYDYPLIQTYVLWIALIYMVVNLLVDVSYARLDPRVRRGARS
ncbi:nickel ABC transporter permease [uncultured Propionibacterium sp.]|uniref:nickel ABC transporter permease n=1 Tax=uncultured Propionibacterium sp. TaxID=218066 RepID=UPI00292E1D9D|nr:nickel ABC transporter permease [uncultured Propionibacterium sp.]